MNSAKSSSSNAFLETFISRRATWIRSESVWVTLACSTNCSIWSGCRIVLLVLIRNASSSNMFDVYCRKVIGIFKASFDIIVWKSLYQNKRYTNWESSTSGVSSFPYERGILRSSSSSSDPFLPSSSFYSIKCNTSFTLCPSFSLIILSTFLCSAISYSLVSTRKFGYSWLGVKS